MSLIFGENKFVFYQWSNFGKFETAMWKAQQKIFIIQQNKTPKIKITANKQTKKITLNLVNEEIFHIETKETW